MTRQLLRRGALRTAAGFTVLVLAAWSAAAQFPGFSPNDQTKVDKSGQNANLKGHPVPPLPTPVDKLPLDKFKLPSGF